MGGLIFLKAIKSSNLTSPGCGTVIQIPTTCQAANTPQFIHALYSTNHIPNNTNTIQCNLHEYNFSKTNGTC